MKAGRGVLFQVAIVLSWYLTVVVKMPAQAVPLPAEDVVSATFISEVSPIAASPNGNRLAYVVRNPQRIRARNEPDREAYIRTGVSARDQGTDIWISEIDAGTIRNLTDGVGSNWAPRWSPDGRFLAFLSDRDGSGQAKLWIWDSTTDNLRLLAEACVRALTLVNDLKWTPDSKNVLATTIPSGWSVERYIRKALSDEQELNKGSLTVPEPRLALYRSRVQKSSARADEEQSPIGLETEYLHDLVSVNVLTGHSIVVASGLVGWYFVSPDGLWVAYTQPKRLVYNAGWPKLAFDLVIVPLATLRPTVVAADAIINAFTWSPTSTAIGYGAYSTDGNGYDYFAVDLRERSPQKVTSLPRSGSKPCCGNPAWDREGENLFFILDGALWRASVKEKRAIEFARIPQRDIRFRAWLSDSLLWTTEDGKSTIVIAHDDQQKQDGFYRIDLLTGQSTRLLETGDCYTCKWARDVNPYTLGTSATGQRIDFIAENASRAPDLWVSEADFQRPRRVTRLNPQFDKYEMGAPRVIEWLSDDGELLHGALLLPSDYRSGEKYPLIVWSYPGSHESNQHSEFGFGDLLGPLNMQLYATRGYAVLFADSTGEVGSPGDGLTKSVLPGVSKVVEMGIADPQRVAVIGHSNGGYGTLALITRTHRFKCAVELSGYGDLVASYGGMEPGGSSIRFVTVEGLLGKGGPWEYPLRYVENSPLFHLDRVETPLLMVHGAQDDEIIPFLADEVFVDMRFLGKRVEYVKYDAEGHVPSDWSYLDQLDLAKRIIAWLDSNLNPTGLKNGSH
jgi:dipeptidyl aminopeptidase/acylaminoacyl peptidase